MRIADDDIRHAVEHALAVGEQEDGKILYLGADRGGNSLLEGQLTSLPSCAGEEGGDDIGGVAVEGHPGSVIAHGRSGVGVAGGFLHVSRRHAGVEGGGDEGVAKRLRSDWLLRTFCREDLALITRTTERAGPPNIYVLTVTATM